ncbi:MazG family protein [Caldisericum exile]|uniref:MazG family protein n=1 Tax=Caldisericum exile (strain DSM 21853 / NBRC 104410 / AZM16c01) TaxID=511051 RepID=A0A7U6GFM3_CALEA|nr:MazG family protein [Caldisericum exile]BAL81447.1 MazG family protein [Caldisericum exile AZM16c01]
MKKLNNFIFDEKLNEFAKCFVVLNSTRIEKDLLVFYFEKSSQIFDILITLSYLEIVNLPTQIIANTLDEFYEILAKFYIYKGEQIPKEISLGEKAVSNVKQFKEIVPYLKINKDIEKFYYTYLLIKSLRKLCPWDSKQTHESLIPELVEEPLECVEEIKKQNPKGVEEELGDVLLQILLHAEIGSETNEFTLGSISDALFNKMYERHPHVFKETKEKSPEAVLNDWENNKKKKKHLNISKILSSFITTVDLQEEAKYIGLEFRNKEEIYDKILEELNEAKKATPDKIKEEIGDLLFSVINLARYLQIDPAHALFISYQKFMERVKKFKALSKEEQQDIDKAWEKIKKDEQ